MTTYVKRKISFQVTEDQGGQRIVLKRGDTDILFESEAALEEGGLHKFVIPIPATNQDLMAGLIITTGRILYIETDTEITVKLAATSDTGFKVKPVVTADAADKRGTLYLEGEFTHVYVTIAGTSGTANVIMGLVGA